MSVRKLSGMLFLVNGLQFVMGAVILLGLQSHMFSYSRSMLDLSVGLVLLSSLLSIAGLFSLLHYQRISFTQSMKHLEELNIRLREQRHDYLNQVQIVHGLLELGEYESAREYLDPVFRDIMKVGRAFKTSQPAVNALLQAKLEEAERQKAALFLEIGTQLTELSIEPWELCKILANLIDNAITAVCQREEDRRITVHMEEHAQEYRIFVENNGPAIPPSQHRLIFGRGYTTKTGEGHGMGLAIVQSAVKACGGMIRMESSEEQTVFFFTIPKKMSDNSADKNDKWRAKLYK